MKRRQPLTGRGREPLGERETRHGRSLVAANLRRLRKKQGLSQERLAEYAGLHRTYVGAVERAERNVSIDNICRLAYAVGVEARDLLAPVRQAR